MSTQFPSPELVAAQAQLATSIGQLCELLAPYGADDNVVPVAAGTQFNVEPLGVLMPPNSEFTTETRERFLADMAAPSEWDGGEAKRHGPVPSGWVTLSGLVRPEYSAHVNAGIAATPYITLTLGDPLSRNPIIALHAVHATDPEHGWRSASSERLVIGTDGTPQGLRLYVPEGDGRIEATSEQVLALDGVVQALRQVVHDSLGARDA